MKDTYAELADKANREGKILVSENDTYVLKEPEEKEDAENSISGTGDGPDLQGSGATHD